GISKALPVSETFDLVVVAFVFHWVSRDALAASVAEVDRVLSPNGYLLLHDFFPDAPTRRHYHHLPEGQAYTYKQDFAALFLSTAGYRHVARTTHHHAHSHAAEDRDFFSVADVSGDDRVVCDLLQKRASYTER